MQARRSARAGAASGFVAPPEPRSVGRIVDGRRLLSGRFRFAGREVEAPGVSIWDVPCPDRAFAAELHGFAWLDDLVAVGDAAARAQAQAWLYDWIQRFGSGSGPGWTPQLAGRRLIRWVHHAVFLMSGQEPAETRAFHAALAAHSDFLARRHLAAAPGMPRIEALTGLLLAGLSLEGMREHLATARSALGHECGALIDAEGGIASRNPEELLEVFSLLTWGFAALRGAEQDADPAHAAAIGRIAPTLRSLRHADGGLARFHGGGRGAEGRLDQALAASGVRAGARAAQAMGFARLAAGRSTVIVDASAPPDGPDAHAATLAFELTSGRRPLIVNCGAGAAFGSQWHRAGRATSAHSTLTIEGVSSSRLGSSGRVSGGTAERLAERPGEVTLMRENSTHGTGLLLSQNGYLATHGLVHVRRLDLSLDGRILTGDEALAVMTPEHRPAFDRALARSGPEGIALAIRFHLHPDVDATLDMGGRAVSLALRSGEIWVLRARGAALALEPSVYLEKGRRAPRPAQQIVLRLMQTAPAAQINWTLAKAQDSPVGIRDFDFDDDGNGQP